MTKWLYGLLSYLLGLSIVLNAYIYEGVQNIPLITRVIIVTTMFTFGIILSKRYRDQELDKMLKAKGVNSDVNMVQIKIIKEISMFFVWIIYSILSPLVFLDYAITYVIEKDKRVKA